MEDKFKKEFVEKLVAEALLPLTKANNWLMKAESIMFKHRWNMVDGKSDIRRTLEEFEDNLEKAWKEQYEKYGVDHVFKLPLNVYKEVCEKFINEPGLKIIKDFVHKATKNPWMYITDPRDNPYILAVGALIKTYNIKNVELEKNV